MAEMLENEVKIDGKEKIKPIELEVGKVYRGRAVLTPYREFCFTPEATGSRAGREVVLMQQKDVTLKKTKQHLLFSTKLPLSLSESEMAIELTKRFNIVFNFLRDYDF